MPEKTGGISQCQFSLPTGQHQRLQERQCRRDEHRRNHGKAKVEHPFFALLHCQYIVEKNLMEHRSGQPRENQPQIDERQKQHGPAILDQLPADGPDDAVGLPLAFEGCAGANLQSHTGIKAAKILPRDRAPSRRRIVDIRLVPVNSFQYDKMIESPMKEERPFLLTEFFRVPAVAFRLAAAKPRRFHNVRRLAAVPADAALLTELLQRNPKPVIGQHHAQRRRTALRRLHLQEGGHLFYPAHSLT